MFVSRNFKVTQKKDKKEFKALDGMLKSRNAEKQEVSQTLRCVDLDQMIPAQLGVSPAILDNVIFTHQTESDWPMRESTELKKRFDDIFESTKYTKALAEIRKVKKTMSEKAKDAERDKEVFATHKSRADNLRSELLKIETELDEIVKEKEEHQKNVSHLEKDYQEIAKEVESSRKERELIKTTEAVIQEKNRTMERLAKDVSSSYSSELVNKSLKELEEMMEKLNSTIKQAQVEEQNYRQQLNAAQLQQKQISSEVEKLTSEKVTLQARQEEGLRHWRRLETQIQDARVNYPQHVKGTTKDLKEIRDQLKLAHKERTDRLSAAEKLKNDEHERLTKILDEKRSNKSVLDSQLQAIKRQRESLLKQDEILKEKIDSYGEGLGVEDRLKELNTLVVELEEKAQALGVDGYVEKKQKLVEEYERNIAKIHEEYVQVEQQVNVLEKQQDLVARMNSKIQDGKSKISKCHALLDTVKQSFETYIPVVFGGNSSSLPDINTERADVVARFNHAYKISKDVAGGGSGSSSSGTNDDSTSPVKRIKTAQEIINDTTSTTTIQQQQQPQRPGKTCADDLTSVCKLWSSQLINRKKEVDKKREDARVAHESFATSNGQVQEIQREIDRLRKEQDTLLAHASIKDIEIQLMSTDNDVGKLEEKLLKDYEDAVQGNVVAGAKTYLEKSMQRLETETHCPMCKQDVTSAEFTPPSLVERSVENPRKVFIFEKDIPLKGSKAVQATIAMALTKIDMASQSQQERIATTKDKLDAFRRDLPKYQKLQTVHERIEQLYERNALQTQDMETKRNSESSLRKEVADMESRLSEPIRVEKEFNECLRLVKEAERLEEAVEQESATLRARTTFSGSGSSSSTAFNSNEPVTLEKARAHLHKLNQDTSSWTKKREDEQKLILAKRNEYQKLLQDMNTARSDAAKLEKDSAKRNELNKERKRVSNLFATQELDAQQLREKLEPVEREIEAAESQRKTSMDSLNHDVQVKREEANKCMRALNTFEDTRTAYEAAIEGDVSKLLEEKTNKLEQVKKESETIGKTITTIYQNIKKSEAQVNNSEKAKDATTQASRYAKMKQEAEDEEIKLTHLKQRVSSNSKSGGINSESEMQRLNQEISKMKMKMEKLTGKQESSDARAVAIRVQLREASLKDIDRKYQEKLFEYKTTGMVVKDLDKYFKALDQALMRYHGGKIQEINGRIAELWQMIYRGGDIDRIELRAERTTTSSISTYSYRVVMRKNLTDLDMRGRSSAGQRVLASLVIRLALAETFSYQCGVLCLDEPTTNLDDENKKGLAIALADLIRGKKNQENFQLIIITHDQEWVSMIHEVAGQGSPLGEGFYQLARKERDGRYVSVIQHRDWSET
jgi:DNA repair protein RAD50